MPGNPFAQYVPASPAPAFPGVIEGPPKEVDPAEQKRLEISQAQLGLSQQGQNINVNNQQVDNAAKLRSEFNTLPAVQQYQTVIRQYDTALKTEPTPTGDQSLITAYAKMLDPTSVVREAEFNTVAAGDSAIGQTVAKLKKELGMDNAGLLRPEVRDRVRREMQNLVVSYNKTYDQAREEYQQFAGRAGVDPALVVGPHLGEPFHDNVEAYWKTHPLKEPSTASGGGTVTTTSDIDPNSDGGPFNRGEYIKRAYGLDPGQEATLVERFNAQRGNANFGIEDARRIYTDLGLPAPADAELEKRVDVARKGGSFSGIDTAKAKAEYNANLDKIIATRESNPDGTVQAIGVNAAQGLTWNALDEIGGIGGALNAVVRGAPVGEGYRTERDVIRREVERSRINNPVISGLSNVAGALASGGAGFRGVTTVRAALAPGAVTGSIFGFNSGEGTRDSLTRAAINAPVGALMAGSAQAAAPYVASALGRVIPERAAPATADQLEVIAAGQRQGVPIRQPDVRPELRNRLSEVETGRGGPIIQRARAADNTAMEGAVANLAPDGSPLEPYQLGNAVQGAGRRFIDRSRDVAGNLYRRAEKLAGGAKIVPQKAVAEVDRQIAELEAQGANNNASLITYLKGMREDLGKAEGYTISEFQGLRSGGRQKIKGDQALTATDADRRLGMVMDALTEDAGAQLPGKAVNALRQADKFYAQRQDFIGGVLKNVMGTRGQPLPAETAANRLMAMTRGKGDYDRFSRMWGALSPEEKADTAATIAQSLGRKANGEFSPSTLIGSLDPKRGLSPQTARLVFGDRGARAINDLRAIAQAKTGSAGAINSSRTGRSVQAVGRGVRNLILSSMGFAAGDVSGAVVAPAAGSFLSKMGEERAARLLMNPDFTGWLRKLPDTANPQQINRQFARLDSVAARVPGMAGDVEAFKQALVGAVNDNALAPSAVAAKDEDQRP